MGSGRLKDGLDTLPNGWQESIVSLYSVGASDVEVKAFIAKHKGSCSNDLWERWMKEEPIFSETIKRGREFSASWWEKNARVNLENKNFNAVLWYMNMKNRFGWADKQEIKQEVTVDISADLKSGLQKVIDKYNSTEPS